MSRPLVILVAIVGLLFVLPGCSTTKKSRHVRKAKKRTEIVHNRPSKATARDKKTSSTKPKVTDEGLLRDRMVAYAKTFVGLQYEYGGKTPPRFDCSGYVSYIYQHNGKKLSGSSSMQSKLGKAKSIARAEKGDLVFFGDSGKVSHVAMVADKKDDKLWVLHSTSSRGVVKDEILHSPYWQKRILFVKDLII